MAHAAVLIGVSSSGNLPRLQAVASGLQRMQRWAETQGIRGEYLLTLSDCTGAKVRAHQIVDAVSVLLERGDLDQLIVYFSGHGIHNGGDYWLLSDAPRSSSEAVNVEASIYLARYCGVPHVVLISDACRTAADGLQMLGVSGVPIFPNEPADGLEREVDAFFACARGKPALEVREGDGTSAAYAALYTEVLSDCLEGRREAALERCTEAGSMVGLVRPWKLADELLTSVPSLLKGRLGRLPSVNQMPVARIGSRDAWVSRLAPPPPLEPPEVEVLGTASAGPLRSPTGTAHGSSDPGAAVRDLLTGVLRGRPLPGVEVLGASDEAPRSFEDWLHSSADAFGWPMRRLADPASDAVFRVRGRSLLSAHASNERLRLFGNGAAVVRPSTERQGGVLLEFSDRRWAWLPALPGHVCELTFQDDELAHVSWEPGDAHGSGLDRRLGAALGAAAGLGRLPLDAVGDAGLVANVFDPSRPTPLSTALYLCYAWHAAGRRDLVARLVHKLASEQSIALLDFDLLAGPAEQSCRPRRPPVPLLSQGWPLLGNVGTSLTAPIAPLRGLLRPSLWTLFDPTASDLLLSLLHATEEVE